jgi:hypothetical protein
MSQLASALGRTTLCAFWNRIGACWTVVEPPIILQQELMLPQPPMHKVSSPRSSAYAKQPVGEGPPFLLSAGLLMYLEEQAVRALLRKLAGERARLSVVAAQRVPE